jgi:amidase
LLYEFKADLNAYLKTLGDQARVKTIDDVIKFNDANKDRELQLFGQDIMVKAAAKGDLNSPAYRSALQRNHLLTRAQGIDAVMNQHRLGRARCANGWPGVDGGLTPMAITSRAASPRRRQ